MQRLALLVRQGEETLEHIVGRVDLLAGDVVAADAGEAPFTVRGAQFRDKGIAVGRAGRVAEAADIEGGDGAHGHVLFEGSMRGSQ